MTGGAMGMGAEHCRGIVREGGSVAIADVADDAGVALAESLGASSKFVHLDVTRAEQWQVCVAHIEASLGAIDILVNNAGILLSAAIDTETPEQFRRILEVNLVGPFLGMRTVTPLMRQRKKGSIVNILSAAGLVGNPNLVGYVASKWGLRGLTKAAALDLAGTGVRVNAVCPGPTETPMAAGVDAATRDAICGAQAIPRMASAAEISKLVLFLASDDASYCTGGDYPVDGGASLGAVSPRGSA
ncbi:MAG TPA: SDR family oxidoreductase [Bradyrhizobium sp.]|nr:SDR family oxidoreductase [Bradyrhizobium sp.]